MSKALHLVKFSLAHLPTLRTWFSSQTELDQWAGPNFRYPHSEQSFAEDLKYQQLASYSLINDRQELLAFGQYYQRLTHCHLGRLVVSPTHRGQGLAKTLIKLLAQQGTQQLELSSLSLFVLTDNLPAVNAYKKMGFIETHYPEPMPLANCQYMVLGQID